MNALDYILANYQQEKYQENLAERTVLKALVHTLNKAELLMLQKKLKRGSSKWSVGRKLCEEASIVLNKIEPPRNESISVLLKDFINKKGGRVAESRIKLRDRFSKQSSQIQRKILKTMLHASKQDRMWAFNRLNHHWDNFFLKDVKNLWEQYHEEESGKVIIRHFPMEYVYDNMSILSTQDKYTNLCIKLMHHPRFHINMGMLRNGFVFSGNPEVEYLYILAKSKSKVEEGYATNLLFQKTAFFLNKLDTPTYEVLEEIVGKKASFVKELHVVRDILWCMGELGLVEELIAFEEWDNKVKCKFYSNEEVEYFARGYNTIPITELWNMYCDAVIECLPNEYQQLIKANPTSSHTTTAPTSSHTTTAQIKEDILQSNPAIQSLIEQLELEVM